MLNKLFFAKNWVACHMRISGGMIQLKELLLWELTNPIKKCGHWPLPNAQPVVYNKDMENCCRLQENNWCFPAETCVRIIMSVVIMKSSPLCVGECVCAHHYSVFLYSPGSAFLCIHYNNGPTNCQLAQCDMSYCHHHHHRNQPCLLIILKMYAFVVPRYPHIDQICQVFGRFKMPSFV